MKPGRLEARVVRSGARCAAGYVCEAVGHLHRVGLVFGGGGGPG